MDQPDRTLALLGGYAVEAVRQILDRLVDALKSLVGRRVNDEVDRARQEGLNVAQQADIRQKSTLLRSIVALEAEVGKDATPQTRAAIESMYKLLGLEPIDTP